MVDADNTTKEQTERSESMRYFVVKSVLFRIFFVSRYPTIKVLKGQATCGTWFNRAFCLLSGCALDGYIECSRVTLALPDYPELLNPPSFLTDPIIRDQE